MNRGDRVCDISGGSSHGRVGTVIGFSGDTLPNGEVLVCSETGAVYIFYDDRKLENGYLGEWDYVDLLENVS